ncbi:hypothetical protein BGZ82_001385 [Podila clonocystis]|nr:hypothetical protein BGZ82_001385 [Podila clonocystis]
MASQLTEQQKADFKESFEAFDRNNDGTINRRELHALLHTVGHKVNHSGLENLLTEYDTDSNGTIDLPEFMQLAGRLMKNKVNSA